MKTIFVIAALACALVMARAQVVTNAAPKVKASVTLIYSDGSGSVTNQWVFELAHPTNEPPIIPPPPDPPPVATDTFATTEANTAVTITLTASDPDDQHLTYSVVAPPANGSLGAVAGDQVTYTPATNYAGTNSFTYKANDGKEDSNVATATITVTAPPPPPPMEADKAQSLTMLAVEEATVMALLLKPERKAKFEIAYTSITALIKSGTFDIEKLRVILTDAGKTVYVSSSARLALFTTGALTITDLVTGVSADASKVPYTKAVFLGMQLGLRSALGPLPPTTPPVPPLPPGAAWPPPCVPDVASVPAKP